MAQRQHRIGGITVTGLIIIGVVLSVVTCVAQSSTSVTQADSRNPVIDPFDFEKYPGLTAEFGKLAKELQQGVQYPPARTQSRLLPLLPPSSTVYLAFSNYGDSVSQALNIFHRELQQNPVLRDWWLHSKVSDSGPKIEDVLQRFSLLSQYLGDEVVMSGSTEAPNPSFFVIAEIRKPGLKNFLLQMAKEKSAPLMRVLDPQELAVAREPQGTHNTVILVRPDYAVAASDMRTLRSVNDSLDHSRGKFVATPFGQRVTQAYKGGVTALVAADLQATLNQAPPSFKHNDIFQQTGFADMKYLVWEHKSVAGQDISQGELSFNSPRRGVASWLAAPIHPGSLDFVSPKAMMVATVALKNPAEIFEDVRGLAGATNPMASAQLAQMEAFLKVRLKEDLFSYLNGEITFELGGVTAAEPVWKVILGVNDPVRLQQTLALLQSAAHAEAQRYEDGGNAYYELLIPSPKGPTKIEYTFADGYLIAGSKRAIVAEAVRVHRNGESLARSEKFLASLPPGHSSGVSALMYQDPIAMTALRMQMMMPEMANNLYQLAGESKPAVVCAYGEETAIREASTSMAVDAGAVLVGAAIAIPNMLRARIAANEASAVGTIRQVHTAQVVYYSAHPERGFAPDLATLGSNQSTHGAGSVEHAGLIKDAECAGAWCTKSGFRFSVTAVCRQKTCEKYVVVGTPVTSNSGSRSFCSASDGVIRFKLGAVLESPISVSECRSWTPIN